MYEAFYGLRDKPFQLKPDPDFFFGSRGHRRAMAYLEYGLHQGEGFIVITGEVGAGKTTLLRNLLRRIPSNTISAAQIVSTQLDADDLVRMVAASFGIDHRGLDKTALLLRLEDHFRYLHADRRRALLVVDEAQNLSMRAVEELRMLSNFMADSRPLLQSFLVGQPEFRLIMQRPEMRQLKQRIIASYHLGPLDRQEIQAYIEHRLRHVGWHDDPKIDKEAYATIYEFSEGVPRRINTLADRMLLAGFLEERHTISAADVEKVARELADEVGSAGVSELAFEASPAVSSAAGAPMPSGLETRISQLEDRVALLEASNTMAYDMLRKLLRNQDAPPPPSLKTGTSS